MLVVLLLIVAVVQLVIYHSVALAQATRLTNLREAMKPTIFSILVQIFAKLTFSDPSNSIIVHSSSVFRSTIFA